MNVEKIHKKITNYVKKHHGIGGQKLKEFRKLENNIFRKYKGKKVTVIAPTTNHNGVTSYKKIQGRVIEKDKETYIFLPKGKSKYGKLLTLGTFEGLYATLTISDIKEGWK